MSGTEQDRTGHRDDEMRDDERRDDEMRMRSIVANETWDGIGIEKCIGVVGHWVVLGSTSAKYFT